MIDIRRAADRMTSLLAAVSGDQAEARVVDGMTTDTGCDPQ